MVGSVEVLATGDESALGAVTLKAAVSGAKALGLKVNWTSRYEGRSDWLCVYGVGHPERHRMREKHVRSGRRVACWDVGYVGRGKTGKVYCRVSIDHNHPRPEFVERTPSDGKRWAAHGIALREDANPDGHIVIAGMGPKSRRHLNLYDWEQKTLLAARKRFPGRRIVYRPKPGNDIGLHPGFEQDGKSPIAHVLKGAALAICRHSNVAIDACIAGVPVECEDGVALWLYRNGPNPTPEQRLELLRRMAWWQWRADEHAEAWRFLLALCA
jgi:hypothetical protein